MNFARLVPDTSMTFFPLFSDQASICTRILGIHRVDMTVSTATSVHVSLWSGRTEVDDIIASCTVLNGLAVRPA